MGMDDKELVEKYQKIIEPKLLEFLKKEGIIQKKEEIKFKWKKS